MGQYERLVERAATAAASEGAIPMDLLVEAAEFGVELATFTRDVNEANTDNLTAQLPLEG